MSSSWSRSGGGRGLGGLWARAQAWIWETLGRIVDWFFPTNASGNTMSRG